MLGNMGLIVGNRWFVFHVRPNGDKDDTLRCDCTFLSLVTVSLRTVGFRGRCSFLMLGCYSTWLLSPRTPLWHVQYLVAVASKVPCDLEPHVYKIQLCCTWPNWMKQSVSPEPQPHLNPSPPQF